MQKLAFIVFKPRKGKAEELIAFLKRSFVILQSLKVASEKPQILASSVDGSIMQIFEFSTDDKPESAAIYPEVRELWKEAEKLSEFLKPSSLKEFQEVFPSFDIIS